MTKREARAGAVVLRGVLAALATMPTDHRSEEAAVLRRLLGAMSAAAETVIAEPDVGDQFLACFEAARSAGATFAMMSRVDRYLVTAPLDGNPAIGIAVAALRFAAVQRARIVAEATFRSRTEVEECQVVLNASFDAVIEYAADAGEHEAFRALTTLFATVTRDLQQRSRPLPRMVTFDLTASLPSLALASRLYGDAARADEVRDENRAPHPLFMPPAGRALSA